MSQIVPFRSALYVPATNSRAMSKIGTLAADFVIVDLEDAVAASDKEHARNVLAEAFETGLFAQKRVVIRINDPASADGAADLAQCAALAPHAVLLPKVETGDMLTRAGAVLAEAGAPTDVKLWAMVETPRGILNLPAIAGAGGRLECLVAGVNDLGTLLRLPPAARREGQTAALSMLVLAARAYGLQVLDGVFNDLKNEAGFIAECEAGRALGFDGKTLVHPSQIAGANTVFAPDAASVETARAIVAAFAAASDDAAVVTVNGVMAERLHLAEARRLIALAEVVAGAANAP